MKLRGIGRKVTSAGLRREESYYLLLHHQKNGSDTGVPWGQTVQEGCCCQLCGLVRSPGHQGSQSEFWLTTEGAIPCTLRRS